ncbi:MAG: EamA family transporter [Acidimicrobiia bacterium]
MAAPASSPRRSGAGVALGLTSAATFGTSGPFAKALLDTGWSPGAAVTARIAIAALILAGPTALTMRGRWHLLRSQAGMIVVYGLVAVAGVQLFFFTAVQTLSVGVALLLEYLGLILVVVWLWVRHRARPRRWTVAGMVLAVVGLALVLDVTGEMEVDPTGVAWGLAAAVGLAAYFVISARDSGGLPPLAMAAGGMVVASVALVGAGAVGVMSVEWSRADTELAGVALPWWGPVLGLALVAGALSYAVGIAAARALGSKLAAFLGLTEVLFAVLFAWLLLDELPLTVQLVGGTLIVVGVAAVRYDELHGDRPEAEALPPADAVGAEPLPAAPPTGG